MVEVKARRRPAARTRWSTGSRRSASKPTPEGLVLRSVMFALRREPDLLIYRQNVGAARLPVGNGRERLVRFGLTKGASDLLGVLAPAGRIVAIELKAARGRTTPEQEAFLQGIRAFGGFACVVRSADEARAAIERARRGEME